MTSVSSDLELAFQLYRMPAIWGRYRIILFDNRDRRVNSLPRVILGDSKPTTSWSPQMWRLKVRKSKL